MTDRSKLLALAEAVEKLSGPDRETDIRIKAAIYGGEALMSPINGEWCVYRAGTTDPRAGKTLERVHDVPHSVWLLDCYTASLDSAMTLVPDTCTVNLMMGKDRPNAAQVHHFLPGALIPHKQSVASAATPALALTAAALRAQAEALS